LFLGISSGAALKASYDLLKKVGETKKILAIAPDGGLKYLSTDTYNK
jgi:cysteine synthase A